MRPAFLGVQQHTRSLINALVAALARRAKARAEGRPSILGDGAAEARLPASRTGQFSEMANTVSFFAMTLSRHSECTAGPSVMVEGFRMAASGDLSARTGRASETLHHPGHSYRLRHFP
jgi:hypothetical protein